MGYAVTNPATGEVVEEFPDATDEQLRSAIADVHDGYGSWRRRSVADRAAVIARAAELFAERTDELAAIITLEMGKRIAESKGEVGLVSQIFSYYADNAEKLLADEPLTTGRGEAVVQKRPIGVVLGIMPWNYPYYQVARFAAPNLVLGNTILLKHAPNCPRSSAAVEQLLRDAGLPEDAYRNIYATNEQVAWMLADPRVQGVSLTGSERAGAVVAAEAGRNLKKVVLELGGSDPYIVLDAENVTQAAKSALRARMGNTGQACNSPKRMIVSDDLYDDFVDQITQQVAGFVPGDPADESTSLAPLSSAAAADRLLEQIGSAVAEGAQLRAGGTRVDGPGSYVTPAVITGVTPQMKVHTEELFGPAVVIYRAGSDEEAVALANDTPFGLGASVFSTDAERAARVGEQLDAGMVYLNSAGGTSAELPFGGVKRSGVGRELGPLGIEEFMNKRLVKR